MAFAKGTYSSCEKEKRCEIKFQLSKMIFFGRNSSVPISILLLLQLDLPKILEFSMFAQHAPAVHTALLTVVNVIFETQCAILSYQTCQEKIYSPPTITVKFMLQTAHVNRKWVFFNFNIF